MRNRVILVLPLALALAACGRGNADKAAVLQGVMDHLAGRNLNLSSMNVEIGSVEFNGGHADATVTFTAKGAAAGAGGMSMRYQLEQQGGKWVVVGSRDSGGAPHGGSGGAAMPAGHGAMQPGAAQPGANPHGAGAAMPSPADLPPTGKQP